MAVSKDDVEKLAKLACVDLSEEEVELYAGQISQILDYVERLNEVDTESVEAMAHPTALSNVFRKDEPRPSLSVADALENAPEEMVGYFQVPPIIEQEQP